MKHIRNTHIDFTIEQQKTNPRPAGIRTVDGEYVYVNDAFCVLVGLSRKANVAGMTDKDLPCGVSDFAGDFLLQDRKVVYEQKRLLTLDVMPYYKGVDCYIFEKSPLTYPDYPALVRFHSERVDLFTSVSDRIRAELAGEQNFSTNRLHKRVFPVSVPRELEQFVYFMLRTASPGRLSIALNMPPRTVYHKTRKLIQLFCDNGFDCTNRDELFELLREQGYYSLLPVQELTPGTTIIREVDI